VISAPSTSLTAATATTSTTSSSSSIICLLQEIKLHGNHLHKKQKYLKYLCKFYEIVIS
jgi:hypothetical protein